MNSVAVRVPRLSYFASLRTRSSSPRHTKLYNMASQSGMKITDWVAAGDKTGEFKRGQSAFRDFISNKPGSEFPAEKDRYHLYASYACPWAHRVLICRKLKGLEDILPVTIVHWHMQEKGWHFVEEGDDVPGKDVTPDPLHKGYTHLREIYFQVDPEYKGRFTVPTLYDKKQGKIVSNESSEILRMLYTEFDHILPEKYAKLDLYPEPLRKETDEKNSWIYDNINNGVYKSGFATKQDAYEKAVTTLFESLDRVEKDLSASPGPYYFGNEITEIDIRLYTTIVRFDAVYQQHFKCNIRDIRSGYPAMHKWLRKLYWDVPAFHDTTQFEHIKKHYTKSHLQINPFSITPVGPIPDILPLDEEVAAVEAALKARKGK